jgi:hypothetical protein
MTEPKTVKSGWATIQFSPAAVQLLEAWRGNDPAGPELAYPPGRTACDIAAESALNFVVEHSPDEWFANQLAHSFEAIQIQREGKGEETLTMVLQGPFPAAGIGESILYVKTLEEVPLGDDYYVARVIRESQYIDIES